MLILRYTKLLFQNLKPVCFLKIIGSTTLVKGLKPLSRKLTNHFTAKTWRNHT